MGRKFFYPVDTDQFEFIRETGRLYVDKTDMLFDIVSLYQYVFLSRPRRFGKSLLCNTFKAYFEGRRELFKGLAIEGLEKDWKRYPVMKFDISNLKNISVDDARRRVIKCGAVLNSDLRNLTHWRTTDISGTVIDEQNFISAS